MPGLVVVLVCLAVYRVTRLITVDEFPPVKLLRDMVQAKFGEDSAVGYLVECPWCASVYVGAVIVGLTVLSAELPVPALVWPTSSVISGWLAMKED
jgi:hypothetical protein